MKIPDKVKSVGVVLPTLILVTLILMMLAGALLTGGTASLRVATHDQQTNQALYVAEAGLVRAAERFASDGSLPQPFVGSMGLGSHFKVTSFQNASETEMEVPTGLRIPPGTMYLLSEGFSENGTSRRAGALFNMGLEAFKLGALAQHFEATNSTFDAFNSQDEDPDYSGPGIDPNAMVDDAAILGSNLTSGEAFRLSNVEVNGSLFVGPGGDPATQITKSGSVSIGEELSLQQAIDVPSIEIPTDLEVPDADDPDPDLPSVGEFHLAGSDPDGTWHFADESGIGFSISPDFVGGDPPGNFQVTGGTLRHGTDAGGGMYVEVFTSASTWVQVRQDGLVTYCDDGVFKDAVMPALAARLWNAYSPGAGLTPGVVTNPSHLGGGAYQSVTIDSGHTAELASDESYLIENLSISGGGKLKLAPGADNVTIYVTGTLTVDGENALLNETLRAPNLKIFYTGGNPVQLAGGSKAFFTLMAPNADISLTGASGIRTQFFGALLGRNVTVENAAFHFDTATSGIGTGTQGTGISFLHRHRL